MRTQLEKPLLDHAGSFVALADGRPVAMAMLSHAGAVGLNDFTCTHPDWRGRGLATLVKAAVIQWASERGLERITTSNDAENTAMLRVNEKLGYRRIETGVQLVMEPRPEIKVDQLRRRRNRTGPNDRFGPCSTQSGESRSNDSERPRPPEPRRGAARAR